MRVVLHMLLARRYEHEVYISILLFDQIELLIGNRRERRGRKFTKDRNLRRHETSGRAAHDGFLLELLYDQT